MEVETENHPSGPEAPPGRRHNELRESKTSIRETIIWILFCLILAAGAFGWGYIYKDHRVDDLREQVHKLDGKQRDMDGRLTAIEGKRK